MKISLFMIVIPVLLTACSYGQRQTQSATPESGILHSAIKPVPNPEESIQDWWLPRHNSVIDSLAAANFDLLFIGNSIINGFEGPGKDVWDTYYKPRNALNMGFGWDRTQHVLWRLANSNLRKVSPKLVIVLIGTNNIGRNSADEISDGIKAICSELKKDLPSSKILLLGILPRYEETSPDRETIKQINTAISKLDDQKTIYFLDIGQSFVDKNNMISKDIMHDLLHPTKKGYQLFAEAIEPSVKKLMEM